MNTPSLPLIRGVAVLCLCSALLLSSAVFADVVSLNNGWRFHRGDVTGAELPTHDDATWTAVDLPHDFSIETREGLPSAPPPPDPKIPDGASVGHLRGGVGWYRLHLAADARKDKGAELLIDGAQQDADVWVNGVHVAFQPHGYIPMRLEMGRLLDATHENVIAIRTLTPDENSRWYSGSGLYRAVALRRHGSAYIPTWGAQVDTLWLKGTKAQVQLNVTVRNDDVASHELALDCRLTSPSGKVSEHALGVVRIGAGEEEVLHATVDLATAEPWEPAAPRLYAAEFAVREAGRTVDTLPVSFGVRTVGIDARRGFLLNGTPLKLYGACLHHDNGILGAAAFPDAERRRVRLMKANGFNAIRTSHNPPSAAFLDACDREGVLVIDEFVDTWELPKKRNGYQRYFTRHWRDDFAAMIRRDFNHPSVVIWSIGNEIPERFSPAGVQSARDLVQFAHHADPRRPTTNAINSIWEDQTIAHSWKGNYPALAAVAVGGYNYTWQEYEADHEHAPEWVMVGTESYPKETREIWRNVERLPYVIGDFVWSGIDYLGESGIGHTSYIDASADPRSTGPTDWEQNPWPCWISWCGDLDIIGNKKPQSLYRDVVWHRSPIEMAVHEPVPQGKKEKVGAWGWPAELPQWNWAVPSGTPLQVSVYTSATQVKLLLNDQTVGEVAVDPTRSITATFTVPYEPGTLTAIAYEGGKEIARRALVTTRPPAALQVTAEAKAAPAARDTLVFLPITVTDATGALVPDAAVPLTCRVTGEAELKALGTGNPTQIESLTDTTTMTFRGRALAILRSTGRPGQATVTVSARGVADASTTVVFTP